MRSLKITLTRVWILAAVWIVTLLVQSNVAWAFEDQRGFFKSENDSIYKVLVPAETGKKQVGISFFRSAWIKQAVRKAKGSELTKLAIISQIEVCESKRSNALDYFLEAPCTVSGVFSHGTAFVAGDSRTIYVARHVLRPGIGFETAMRGVMLSTDQWPMYVFDRRGNLLLDTTKEHVTVEAAPIALNGQRPDIMRITLSRAIGRPLMFAQRSPVRGEVIATIGYPGCTGCNEPHSSPDEDKHDWTDRAPFPNSDGSSQYISKGVVMDETYFRSIYGVHAMLFDPDLFIFSNVDCVRGNSGGPGLNERGEVFGVLSSGGHRRVGDRTERICAFSRLLE
jgi:hypothetical protein